MRAIGVFKTIGVRFAWDFLLFAGIFLLSTTFSYAQLKEVELSVVKEQEAMQLKMKGGMYVYYSDVPARNGGWVQYRKVMRVEPGAYDPGTGERWYNVYLSQIIPLEYPGRHDPGNIENGCLWTPYDAEDPWRWQNAAADIVWKLDQGYPIWNPNYQPLERRSKEGVVTKTSFYHDGLTQRVYKTDEKGALEYDWLFTLRWSQLPPDQLVPGQSFGVELSAEARGQLLREEVRFSARIDAKGFQVRYDPEFSAAHFPVMVGRLASDEPITFKDNCLFVFTLPDDSPEEVHLSLILNDWGGVVTYKWKKLPLH